MQGQAAVAWTRWSGITALVLLASALLVAPAGAWSDAATTPTTTTTTEPPGSSADDASPSTSTTTTTQPAVMTETDSDTDAEPSSEQDAWLTGRADDVVATAGTFTVTPSTGLGYAESVTVQGSGYVPNSLFGVIQCKAGLVSIDDCVPSTLMVGTTNAAGEFTRSITVRRFFYSSTGLVDCASGPGVCAVGAGPSFGESFINAVPLTFDSGAAIPPDPVVDGSPKTGLGLEESVTVTGAGFEPDAPVSIRQCITGTIDIGRDCGTLHFGSTNADSSGAISTTMDVRRGLRTAIEPTVDCLDAPGCELIVFSLIDPVRDGRVQLGFDASVPVPPPPTVVVTPATGLADYQFITVSASGFEPSEEVLIGQCQADSLVPARCGTVHAQFADADGNAQYTFRAHALIGAAIVECGVAAGTCVGFAASVGDPFAYGSVPLEFDPNAMPTPRPVVTVSPATGLKDGDIVAISGTGFSAHQPVQIMECRDDVDPVPFAFGFCDFSTAVFMSADSSGAFQFTLAVRRVLSTAGASPYDCGVEPAGCSMSWLSLADSFERGTTPLEFAGDPINAPGGLPRTGAPAVPLAALGGALCLVGALFLVAVRTRPARDRWHAESTRPCKGDCDAGRS